MTYREEENLHRAENKHFHSQLGQGWLDSEVR